EKAFALKFFEYQNDLSASWIGTRIKRVALSRRNLFNESMGYLDGGSAVLLERMAAEVTRLGGRILLSQPIEEVASVDGKVTGIRTRDGQHAYDGVVSTAPIQYVPGMVPGLPKTFADQVTAIENIPVACVILKLSEPVSENFWMNISDDRIAIPGLIEYSNLNPGKGAGEHIVYAPYYMPKTHPKWQWS
ncbi:FAD-dependent oxidoreductase, partial [Xanthomonas maliensis]